MTDHIVDITRRLSDDGWFALAPALYHRNGSPIIDYEDMPAAMAARDTLTPAGLRMDLIASLTYLEQAGFDDSQIATIGFCVGGSIAFWLDTIRPLAAAITFYGGGIVDEGKVGLPPLEEGAASLKGAWLGLYGDLDHGIPADDVEALRVALKEAKPMTNIVRYENAGHGFHCDARPAHFEPDSAKDAWSKTMAWLNTYVVA